MAAVTMDKIQFYQPPNPMSATKPQSPNLPAIFTPPKPPARRPNPTADAFTSLFWDLVGRREPTTWRGRDKNADEHATIPSGSNLIGFASDRLGMPVEEADKAAESATEAGLRAYWLRGSRDGPIVVDGSTEIGHGGEHTSKSAGGQTSSPPLPAREAPTDQGDELDGMADDDRTSLTPREVPETPPPFTMGEVGTARAPNDSVSPHPGGRPQISAGHAGATQEEWMVKRILDSRIRVRNGTPRLEYRVAWRPTWQPRSDLIPGCEELVKKFHAEWKDKRPSLTTLTGHMRFKQKRGSRRDGGCKIVKSIG
ncbi:predicted protein [Histoplasma mississippiense (nom. inval.)]|uniref:predicted protein n=1 Tax=Ajellomyces capsulatus (strain NAm1 / WU24) TaxID=2059318 RepID=UPI000157C245|nr:predicted protein [Histoplasma mississippiense (nom. inval.)]EDN07615.1 predicted protein [Histoplasma mississippiense (nom. inval.)]